LEEGAVKKKPADGVRIDDRRVGAGAAAYIVAELSANHHHDFNQAVRLIRAAKEAGADAVKLQTYTADTMTIDCANQCFQIGRGTIWEGRRLYDLYKQAHTPWDWQPKLKKIADECGLPLFSSPFDSTAVDFLERLDVPAYKIASFELVDLPLIRRVAQTGKPVIMSTGLATMDEIQEAVSAARKAGARQIAVLKCTSAYPASPAEMNLRTIPHLAKSLRIPVGLSDHTLSVAIPAAAVVLGACLIEKHLTLSRKVPGPDSAFSLEPPEFKAMVETVRMTEQALGRVSYGPRAGEMPSLIFRRSLFVVEDMVAGEAFTAKNVRSIRPGQGLHTRHLPAVLGRRAARDIERGTPLSWDLVSSRP